VEQMVSTRPEEKTGHDLRAYIQKALASQSH
jgi:hypothetical protein